MPENKCIKCRSFVTYRDCWSCYNGGDGHKPERRRKVRKNENKTMEIDRT